MRGFHPHPNPPPQGEGIFVQLRKSYGVSPRLRRRRGAGRFQVCRQVSRAVGWRLLEAVAGRGMQPLRAVFAYFPGAGWQPLPHPIQQAGRRLGADWRQIVVRVKGQAEGRCPLRHPLVGRVRQVGVRASSADVPVRSGEPDLLDGLPRLGLVLPQGCPKGQRLSSMERAWQACLTQPFNSTSWNWWRRAAASPLRPGTRPIPRTGMPRRPPCPKRR